MRVIIAGSRSFVLPRAIELVLEGVEDFEDRHGKITEVVSGGASGIDSAGAIWANLHKLPLKEFLADWEQLGMAAGPVRNSRMANYAAEAKGGLLLIWDGKSRGSASMKQAATKKKLLIHERVVV